MTFLPRVILPAVLSSHARWFVCGENEVLLRRGTTGLEQLPSTSEVASFGIARGDAQMIGTIDGDDALAAAWEGDGVPDGFERVGLRALWARLDEALFMIAGRANQLVEFAGTHVFCGRCASKNTRHESERALRCPKCGLVSYPRISPAIITLVRRGDEALLADSGRFPIPMFSTLAGFAEVGESLEETLVREVGEEVGITVKNVRYFGSQPWPFPHSLMVGFTADYAGGEVKVDGKEIKEAAFFRANALPRIPPKLSIAHALINAWVKEITGGDIAE